MSNETINVTRSGVDPDGRTGGGTVTVEMETRTESGATHRLNATLPFSGRDSYSLTCNAGTPAAVVYLQESGYDVRGVAQEVQRLPQGVFDWLFDITRDTHNTTSATNPMSAFCAAPRTTGNGRGQ